MSSNNKKIKYKILKVVHSGRKGTRYKPIKDPKYDGLVGSIIETENIENTKMFDEIKWDFVENKPTWYDWWHTSPVIQITLNFSNQYEIETINTIYILEKIYERNKDEPDSRQSK